MFFSMFDVFFCFLSFIRRSFDDVNVVDDGDDVDFYKVMP